MKKLTLLLALLIPSLVLADPLGDILSNEEVPVVQGNPTTGNIATWDANNNLQDGGAVPGGTDVVLDLADDASDESTAINEIATSNDTNSIFTEPSADKLLVDMGQNWPTADAATALSANGANCSAGNYPLGVDASGAAESCTADDDTPDSDGEVPDAITVDGGTVQNSTTILQDANGAAPTTDGEIKYDRTTERLEVGDGVTTQEFYPGAHTVDTDTNLSEEEVEDFVGGMLGGTETRISVTYDDAGNAINFVVDDMNDDVPESGDFGNADDLEATGELSADVVDQSKIADDAIQEEHLKAVNAAVDEDIVTYEATTGDFEYHTCAEITGSADLCDGSDDGAHGDGANCSAGNYPLGVDANGAVQSCTADDDQPDDDSEVPNALTIAGGTIGTSQITLEIGTNPTTDGVIRYNTTTERIQVGDDGVATLDFYPGAHTVDTDTNLSEEQVEDFVGGMLGGTETRISVTYDDAGNAINFVVDDMNDDVPESGDFGNADDLEATGELSADVVDQSKIANDAIQEEHLKAVNAAVDEDIVTYEATTGDFEYHTCAEITGSADLCDGNDADTNTNADTLCSGTTTYLDGEGNCDTIDGVEDLETATDDAVIVGNGTTFDTKVIPDCDLTSRGLNYDTTTNSFSCQTYSSVTDTNANTECAGTTTYLDGEGNCDDISSVYQAADADLDDLADGSLTGSKVGSGIAAGNVTTGTLTHERGGLEADLSAYNGLVRINGGATSNITNLSGLNTALGSSVADGAHTTDTNANTLCSGSTTYLDGEGNCDDISSVYQAADADLTDLADGSLSGSKVGSGIAGDNITDDSIDDTEIDIRVTGFHCGGRVTVVNGTTVPTSDQSNINDLYFDPHVSEYCHLYTGSTWVSWDMGSGVTITNSGLSNSTNYDVFIDYNGGSPQIQLTAWSSATARATALTTQDGVYVKSGATDHLYVGTVRTDSSGFDFTDTDSQRFVWNMYNRVRRHLLADGESTASWTYSTASTWRAANGSTTVGNTRVEMVVGLNEETVSAFVASAVGNGGTNAWASVGIALDSTTTSHAQARTGAFVQSDWNPLSAKYEGLPGIGYHYLQWVEWHAGGSKIFYATCSGGCEGGLTAHMDM